MKRALRDTDTSMFIKSDLTQTGLIEEARCFENYQEVFAFCHSHHLDRVQHLDRVELVVRFSDQYEYTLPMLALAGVPSQAGPISS